MSKDMQLTVTNDSYLFAVMMFAQSNSMTFGDIYNQRVHAFVAMLGALLATTIDFPSGRGPKSRSTKIIDVSLRVVAGGLVGLMFGAMVVVEVCRYLERELLVIYQMGICFLLGFLSWFILKGILSLGKKLKDPDVYRRLVAVIFNFDLSGDKTPKPKKRTTPAKVVDVDIEENVEESPETEELPSPDPKGS